MIYSEAESFLSGINHERQDSGYHYSGIDIDTQNLPSGNSSVWQPELTNVLSAGQFSSAPNFHSINGYIYANNPPFEMCLGDDVIWYVTLTDRRATFSTCMATVSDIRARRAMRSVSMTALAKRST
jgi:hypothetical protein